MIFSPEKLHDELIGALVGLARAVDASPDPADPGILIEGLCAVAEMTGTGPLSEGICDNSLHTESLTAEVCRDLIERLHAEKYRLVPDCAVCASPCGRTADLDLDLLKLDQPEVRDAKMHLLTQLAEAALAIREAGASAADGELVQLLYEGLFRIGYETEEAGLADTAARLAQRLGE